MTRFLLPLAIFSVLVVFLGVGLTLNPRQVPSPLVDKPAPVFQLNHLHDPDKTPPNAINKHPNQIQSTKGL